MNVKCCASDHLVKDDPVIRLWDDILNYKEKRSTIVTARNEKAFAASARSIWRSIVD